MNRRGLLPALVLPAALFAIAASVTARAAPLASVRAIHQGLGVRPPSKPMASGHIRQPLFTQYLLRTRAGQRASLGFGDGSVLQMNQNTDLVLRSPKLTVLQAGEVEFLDRPASGQHIQTATAVASVAGTDFDVRIGSLTVPRTYASPAKTFPAGTTTVSVITGAVVVSNRFGSVRVRPGQWTHVAPSTAPTLPTTHNARRDVAWDAGLPPPSFKP